MVITKEKGTVAIHKSEGLREQKKRQTRQQISNEATRLFMEHGFDNVTLDDVALAANVSKMTVFNYFSRKEELLFDRLDEMVALLDDALKNRATRSPIAVFKDLTTTLIAQNHPITRINEGVVKFWQVVVDSPTLSAYGLSQFELIGKKFGAMLAASVGAPDTDPTAQLLAFIMMNTWRIAALTALRYYQQHAPKEPAFNFASDVLRRGFCAAETAASGTAYR